MCLLELYSGVKAIHGPCLIFFKPSALTSRVSECRVRTVSECWWADVALGLAPLFFLSPSHLPVRPLIE